MSTSHRQAGTILAVLGMLTNSLQDATTNPSLILAAANKAGYARLIDAAVAFGKSKGGDINTQVNAAMDRLVSMIRIVWCSVLIVFVIISLSNSARRFSLSSRAGFPLRSMLVFPLTRKPQRPRCAMFAYTTIPPDFSPLGQGTYCPLRFSRCQKRSYSHQNRLNLGGYPSCPGT